MPLFKSKKKKESKDSAHSRDVVPPQASGASLNSIESATSKETMNALQVYETPKIKDQPAIHRAVWKENLSKFKSATKDTKPSNINCVDKQHRTALHIASAKGLEEFIIHLVVVCRADINARDKDGCTPIHRLIEGGHSNILAHMLDHDAKPDIPDRQGSTPLHVAAEMGDNHAVQLLLAKDTQIDAINKDGWTPLHLATYGGSYAVVQQLLEDGADPNAQDGSGRTTLMYACSLGYPELVQLLCDYEADFEMKDAEGEKAQYYATSSRTENQECLRVLEAYQLRLEKEAENAASPSPPPLANHSGLTSSHQLAQGVAVADGRPAMGYARTPDHHSYTSYSQADPDTLNDSWAPSDTEELAPHRPSLLAEGLNIMKAKEKETSKTVKIGSSVTLPSTFTPKHPLDPTISAPATQSSGQPPSILSRRDGVENTTHATRSPARTSIRTSRTDIDGQTTGTDGYSGHPDWFVFDPEVLTDESEPFSNLSDLLRDRTTPRQQRDHTTPRQQRDHTTPRQQQPTHVSKHTNAEKLIDEAALSSPESRGREKVVRYAQSQPSYRRHSQPQHDGTTITSASYPNFPSEAELVTTRRTDRQPPESGGGAVSQSPRAPHSQPNQVHPDIPASSPQYRGSLQPGQLQSHHQYPQPQSSTASSPQVLSSPRQKPTRTHTPSGLVESMPHCPTGRNPPSPSTDTKSSPHVFSPSPAQQPTHEHISSGLVESAPQLPMTNEVCPPEVESKSSPNVIRYSPQTNAAYEQAMLQEQSGDVSGYQSEERSQHFHSSMTQSLPKYAPSDSEVLSVEDKAATQKYKSSPYSSPLVHQQSVPRSHQNFKRNTYPATHPYNILPLPTQPPQSAQEYSDLPQEYTDLPQENVEFPQEDREMPLGVTEVPQGMTELSPASVAVQQTMTSLPPMQPSVKPHDKTYTVSSQKTFTSTSHTEQQVAKPLEETYTIPPQVDQHTRLPDSQPHSAEARYSPQQEKHVYETARELTRQHEEVQPTSAATHATPPVKGSPVTSLRTKQEMKKVTVTSYTTTSTSAKEVASAQTSPMISSAQVQPPEDPVLSGVGVPSGMTRLVDRSSSPYTLDFQDDKSEGTELLSKRGTSTYIVSEPHKVSRGDSRVPPLQSTMISSGRGTTAQSRAFSSYFLDLQKRDDVELSEIALKKKLDQLTSSSRDLLRPGAAHWTSSDYHPASTSSALKSSDGKGLTRSGLGYGSMYTSAPPLTSTYTKGKPLFTSTAVPSTVDPISSLLATSTGRSPIYTPSPINATYTKSTETKDKTSRSPVLTHKRPITTPYISKGTYHSSAKGSSFSPPGNTSFTTKLDVDLGIRKSFSFSSSSGLDESSADKKLSSEKSPKSKSRGRSLSPKRTFVTNISISRSGNKGSSKDELFNVTFDSSEKNSPRTPRIQNTSTPDSSSPRSPSSKKKSMAAKEHSHHHKSCPVHGGSSSARQQKQTKHVTVVEELADKEKHSDESHSERKKASPLDSTSKSTRSKSKEDGVKSLRKSRMSSPAREKYSPRHRKAHSIPVEDSDLECASNTAQVGSATMTFQEANVEISIAGHSAENKAGYFPPSGSNESLSRDQDRLGSPVKEDPPIAGISLYSLEHGTDGQKVSTSERESPRPNSSREESRSKRKRELSGHQSRDEKRERRHHSGDNRQKTNSPFRTRSRNHSNEISKTTQNKKSKEKSADRHKCRGQRRSRDRSRGRSTEDSSRESRSRSKGSSKGRIRDSIKYRSSSKDRRSRGRSKDNYSDESRSSSLERSRHGIRYHKGSRSESRRSGEGRSPGRRELESLSDSASKILVVDAKLSSVDIAGNPSLSESHLHSSFGHGGSTLHTSISCDPAIMLQTSTHQEVLLDSEVSQTTMETSPIFAKEPSGCYSGHYEELCTTKARLEQQLLKAELEIRELKYNIRQKEETVKVNKVLQEQLRDHIKKLEGRLGAQVEGREAAELKVREYEVEERTKKLSFQQLQDQEQLLRDRLQAEVDARQLQEGLYHEQVRVFQALQSESTKCQIYQAELEKKLEETNRLKMNLESQLSAAKSEIAILQDEVTSTKQREILSESSHHEEREQLELQLKDYEEKNMELEQNLLDMRNVFELSLQELQSKAQFVGEGLDSEATRRKSAEEQVVQLKRDQDKLFSQHQEAMAVAQDREQNLCQKLEEKIREESMKECELKSTKEVVSHQKARLENTEAQLNKAEKVLKTAELEMSQKNGEFASLEQGHQKLQEKLSRLEEYCSVLEKRSKDYEAKFEKISERNSVLEIEKERLLQQAEFSRLKQEEVGGVVKELQVRVEEMTESSCADRERILDLQGKYKSEQTQRVMVEENLSKVKRELTSTLEAKHRAEGELRELQKKIVVMEHDMGALSNQDSLNRAELKASRMREVELKKEMQYMTEMRKTLEGVMSEKQDELVKLQDDLVKTISVRDSSTREAEELKNLWEAEVKTKARLTQKVLEMESALAESKAEAGTALSNEKRRSKKASDSKKALESRLETVQAYYSNLESEVNRLKGELRVTKIQLKKMQQKEKLIGTMQTGYEEEKTVLVKEKEELQAMLESTRDQLKLEGEAKLQAQFTASKAREDLDLSFSRLKQEHGEVAMKDKEVGRLTQLNHQLQDEIMSLKNTLADYTLCKKELEGYKKEIQEKARRELMQKLEEVNSHMDQQSHVQESLIKMHQDKEAEWRSKYNQAQDLVRQLQSEIKIDIERKNAENTRLKSMLQKEIQHAERLASQVRRSQEEVEHYKARLSMEKSRTDQLLKVSQKAASSALASMDVNHTHMEGDHTHQGTGNSVQDGVQYQSLLCSVRAQLDQSISRHMDSARVSVTAKEVTTPTAPSKSKSFSNLDSIQRNYHV